MHVVARRIASDSAMAAPSLSSAGGGLAAQIRRSLRTEQLCRAGALFLKALAARGSLTRGVGLAEAFFESYYYA